MSQMLSKSTPFSLPASPFVSAKPSPPLSLGLILVSLLSFFASCSPSSPSGPRPVDLRCQGQVNPLGVSASPHLTWRMEADANLRGQHQTAWQILVASSPARLTEADADLWNSGKIDRTRSPQVAYGGTPLSPGQRYYWQVRFWDADGSPSPWSDVAHWEVAPLSPSDWHGARWITDGKQNPTRDADFYEPDPAPLMRQEFFLTQPVKRARLHVAGLGLCYPSLNGERLQDHVFDPPWTDFDERILFRTHDVTSHLRKGVNCLGLELGNGWYNPLPLRMWGRRNIRETLPVGRPRAIACLVVEYTDGSRITIPTGPDWLTHEGPTLRNSLYLGEVHDARMALPGWNQPGYDDSGWRPVSVTNHSLEPLQPLVMPPVQLSDPFPVDSIHSPEEDVYIVDFGNNFTGLPEMKLDVPEGTRVRLRFGELLFPDGTLNTLSSVCGQIKGTRERPDGTTQPMGGPGAPEIAWQEDTYIARGGGPEHYRPHFTFHGFRYMEITGLPDAPETADIHGRLMRTGIDSAGTFSSSNDLLNRIQQACRQSFLTNIVTVQSDCPHRERFAYGGDIVATSEAYLMNFDMAAFYTKTVRDWADGALPDGRLPDTAPFVGIDYCGVGWAMVHPLLLEQLYQHYGKTDLIREQLPVALRWIRAEAARRENALVVTGLGDHEALIPAKGPEFTTPKFIHSALRLARLARLINEDNIAREMEERAAESTTAWKEAFLDPDTGQVGQGTQSSQAFALGFDAAPPAAEGPVFQRLVENLTALEDAPRLTTGIYGTRILLEELPERGRHDLAYALASRATFPSWGWMIKNDATTLWESWDGTEDGRRSHNHPMFGSISSYFFRWLGGIQAAPDAVGFDRLLIRPQIVTDLDWVQSSHHSIRGTITSNWSKSNDGTQFEIVIPPDTIATILLPTNKADQITENGTPLPDAKDIQVLGPGPFSTTRIQAPSGHYHFTLSQESTNP